MLISTYNGEKYIEEQISSICRQGWGGELEIIIRDDGSRDQTPMLLNKLKRHYETKILRFRIICGDNVGVVESFFLLCRSLSPQKNDLVYFADQDDEWMPDRVIRVNEHFQGKSSPQIYCGSLQLVNDSLEPTGLMNHMEISERNVIFPAIVNHITGCALVLNGAAFERMDFSLTSKSIMMHDWWVACQAYFYSISCFYDIEPTVRYRQHDFNVVGASSAFKNFFSFIYWKKRLNGPKRIEQLGLLQREKIKDVQLRLEFDNFVAHGFSVFGRILLTVKYFARAKVSRWLLFVFLG